MATTDKHPPRNSERRQTHKRVKPLGENIFGAPYLTAEGSKRVKPGDPNTTGAKVQEASETLRQRWIREEDEQREKLESFLSDARRQMLKRGWMTSTELRLMKRLKGKRQKV